MSAHRMQVDGQTRLDGARRGVADRALLSCYSETYSFIVFEHRKLVNIQQLVRDIGPTNHLHKFGGTKQRGESAGAGKRLQPRAVHVAIFRCSDNINPLRLFINVPRHHPFMHKPSAAVTNPAAGDFCNGCSEPFPKAQLRQCSGCQYVRTFSRCFPLTTLEVYRSTALGTARNPRGYATNDNVQTSKENAWRCCSPKIAS